MSGKGPDDTNRLVKITQQNRMPPDAQHADMRIGRSRTWRGLLYPLECKMGRFTPSVVYNVVIEEVRRSTVAELACWTVSNVPRRPSLSVPNVFRSTSQFTIKTRLHFTTCVPVLQFTHFARIPPRNVFSFSLTSYALSQLTLFLSTRRVSLHSAVHTFRRTCNLLLRHSLRFCFFSSPPARSSGKQ